MLDRLLSILNKHGVLSDSQFGFRKGKNTTDPLLHYVEYVYIQLNGRNHTIIVFEDFSKAFDTVNHPTF